MATQTDVVVAASAPTTSPVSWAAIFAGGVVAAAATLVLMLLGSGLGLTMVSPWASQSASGTTVVVSAALWLVVVQWISSCMGGYIAGRLRKRRLSTATKSSFVIARAWLLGLGRRHACCCHYSRFDSLRSLHLRCTSRIERRQRRCQGRNGSGEHLHSKRLRCGLPLPLIGSCTH